MIRNKATPYMACCWWCRKKSSSLNDENQINRANLDESSARHEDWAYSTARNSRRAELQSLYEQNLPESIGSVFQTVRILVVGRSGSGKTTLIRLLLGEDGPQLLGGHGLPGRHDIEREWRWTAHHRLPLVFHDSNGMDVASGRKNLDTVRSFLTERQKSSDIASKIHLIWYVIGANDNRIADDGDLMATVASCAAGVPILLIMTYNDVPQLVGQHVTPTVLDNLFRSVSTPEVSADIRRRMVRVGNAIRTDEITGEIYGDIDYDGLFQVSRSTMELLDKHLQYTWIASQAVDMEAKLDATVSLILEIGRRGLTTDLFRRGPTGKLISAFRKMQERVCEIWRVPRYLREALSEIVVEPLVKAAVDSDQRSRESKKGRVQELIRFIGFVVTLGASQVTINVNVGGIVKAGLTMTYDEEKRAESQWTWRILECGVRLLMAILFVMSRQPLDHDSRRKHRWGMTSAEAYQNACRDFMDWSSKVNGQWAEPLLLESSAGGGASSNTTSFLMNFLLRPKRLANLIADFALQHYKLCLLHRPNSLYSQLHNPQDHSFDNMERTRPSDVTNYDESQLSYVHNSAFAANDDGDGSQYEREND